MFGVEIANDAGLVLIDPTLTNIGVIERGTLANNTNIDSFSLDAGLFFVRAVNNGAYITTLPNFSTTKTIFTSDGSNIEYIKLKADASLGGGSTGYGLQIFRLDGTGISFSSDVPVPIIPYTGLVDVSGGAININLPANRAGRNKFINVTALNAVKRVTNSGSLVSTFTSNSDGSICTMSNYTNSTVNPLTIPAFATPTVIMEA
jgi:hypothetical protein